MIGYATKGALASFSITLPPNSAMIGYAIEGALASLFTTLPPNSAITGYANEGKLFISVHMPTNLASSIWKVRY